MFVLTAATVAVVLGFVASGIAEPFPYPVLFSDGLSPHVDATFMTIRPQNRTSFVPRPWGTLPAACNDAARELGLFDWDIEVYEITYTDCSTPWVFCRHHAADLDQQELMELFGRLPVKERQWIRHVIALPGGGSAYMSNADVVFVGNANTVSVFQHEVGHAVDFYKNSIRSSASSIFTDAVANDTCVPDDYSNTNYIEDYTQVSVLVLFDIVAKRGLNATGVDWSCLRKQKEAVDALQRDHMIYGGTCGRRWPDSPSVPMDGNQTRRAVRRSELDPAPYRSPTTYFKDLYRGN